MKKRRGGTNRYGMRKPSGRRFRAERMNILGMRKTTEFSLDEVRVNVQIVGASWSFEIQVK